MSMTTKLNVEIEGRLDKLSKLDSGTKEYAEAVDSVTKLMDRSIEIKKLEESETRTEKQMKEERKSRIVKNLIDVGGIVLPLAVTLWGVKASLYFEDSNTVTTTVGRKFMDRMFNFKR